MLRRSSQLHRTRVVVDSARATPTLTAAGICFQGSRRQSLKVASSCWGTRESPHSKTGTPHGTAPLLSPLYTNEFSFHDNHLTTLGESIIQSTLSDALCEYCLSSGHLMSANASEELLAVLLNSYTLRYLAEHRLAMLETVSAEFATKTATMAESLGSTEGEGLDQENSRLGTQVAASLEAPQRGPSLEDVKGTSFDVSPHAFAASSMSRKLLHFVGAVAVDQGQASAGQMVRRMYHLEGVDKSTDFRADTNVPRLAARLLHTVMCTYSQSNVALSILAAQGIRVKYETRTISFQDGAPVHAQDAVDPDSGTTGATDQNSATRVQKDDVATQETSPSQQLRQAKNEGLQSFQDARQMDSFDAADHLRQIAKWHSHSAAPDTVGTGGWLTSGDPSIGDDTHNPNTGGSAIIPRTYFADKVGVEHPAVGGKHVVRRQFEAATDQVYYSEQREGNSGKDGIKMDTGGLSIKEYLATFSPVRGALSGGAAPTNTAAGIQRMFEVRVFKEKEITTRSTYERSALIGKAVAPRYTSARTQATRQYLSRLAEDLQKMASEVHR